MNRKRTLLIVIVFLLAVSVIGASYAYFAATTSNKGNDEITEITTEELGSIKWEGTKVYESGDSLPGEIGIQTFKVSKNSDNGKGIYEIDLEGIIDEAFNEDVLISLYKTTEPDKNYVKVTEGESTITGDDDTKMYYKEDKLQAVGTPELVYGPRALETKDPIILYQADFDNTNFPETTFYLVYEYLNKDNQDAEQGKSFSGTINVRLILEKIIGEESDIDITYTSNRNDYVNTDETLTITATSEKYNIARYSFDNIIYTPVDNPSKTVTITKTYTEEKDNIIYFKDDVGNTKSKTLDLFLDKTGPSITAKTTLEWDKTNTISITLEDEKSGLAGYALTETETDPSEWTSITGKSTTIAKDVTSNKKYYVYAKDVLGNISHKDVEVSHVDETAPVINEINEQENYGATSVISVSVKDNETGIVGYAFTTTNEEPTEWTSVDNVITEEKYTYEASSNGTIYFWVKDRVGNITSKPINVTKVDTTAPTITLSLSDELTWTSSKTLTMNFSDDESGLLGYKVTRDDSEPTEWLSITGFKITKTETIIGNGLYYIWVKDKAGLVTCVTKFVSYADSEKPVASMKLTSTSDSITIDASSSIDTESGIVSYEYSLDDIHYYYSMNPIYTFTDLAIGEYTVYLKVRDKTGNEGFSKMNVGVYQTFTNELKTLASTDTTNLMADDYENLRYVGDNPSNYVKIGDSTLGFDLYEFYYNGEKQGNELMYSEECNQLLSGYMDMMDYNATCELAHSYNEPILWRVIGVIKDVDDGNGNKSDRVKLIRQFPIGNYSWDTSLSAVNGGYGVNEWSLADIMKLLNPGYENNKDKERYNTEVTVNNSLFWNKESGLCFTYSNNTVGTSSDGGSMCDFKQNGLSDELKSMIDAAVWNTGAITNLSSLTSSFYEQERSTSNGKICTSGNYCNDTIGRTSSWTGKVGFMYPSDYGYAIGGSSRDKCLKSVTLDKWKSNNDCSNGNWLLNVSEEGATMTPGAASNYATNVYSISTSGYAYSGYAYYKHAISPVVYLKTNVKVTGGDGSIDNPFTLEN